MEEEFSAALLTGCVLLASCCWAPPCKTCRTIRPPHADQPAAEGKPRCAPAPTTNDPRVHPAYPGRPRGRAGHRPPPPNDDGQVQTDASADPAPPAPASSARRRLSQTTSRAWTQPATTPTPAIPAIRLPAHRRAPRPHFGRTQRTRTHRHRTPDSGHLDAQTPAPDTGQRSHGQASVDTGRSHRTPDTGHRTPAEDADRVTKARPASGLPEPPRRATARWDAQPCSCGQRLRRSTAHAGSAGRPPSSAR
jgi:hypothetical protein